MGCGRWACRLLLVSDLPLVLGLLLLGLAAGCLVGGWASLHSLPGGADGPMCLESSPQFAAHASLLPHSTHAPLLPHAERGPQHPAAEQERAGHAAGATQLG